MPIAKLSKRAVDALVAGPRPYITYDAELKGFGVKTTPSGTKTWVVEYRAGAGGRRAPKKRLSLGTNTALTPDQARKTARQLLAAVRLGDDPAADRAAKRVAPTVAEMIEAYLRERVAPKMKLGTVALYKHLLQNLVAPKLGTYKAEEVTRTQIERLHNGEKDRRPVIANRAIAALSACYRWASERGMVPAGTNPAANIKKFREQGRERYLSTDELERLGAAICEAETVGIPWDVDQKNPLSRHLPKTKEHRTTISPHAAAALRLLILTGAPLREILHLRWEEVDLQRGVLRLRDSKTGPKVIVLNSAAISVLETIPRTSIYVITGNRSAKPRADLKRPWLVVSKRANIAGVRIHDLRHSFASVGIGSGISLAILGKLLGHAHASTTERYAHLDNDPLRRAANEIGARIAATLGQSSTGQRSVAS